MVHQLIWNFQKINCLRWCSQEELFVTPISGNISSADSKKGTDKAKILGKKISG